MTSRSKYAYLLLRLTAGNSPDEVAPCISQAIEACASRLGIELWTWQVQSKSRMLSSAYHRIFFTVPSGLRDDIHASNFAEGILLSAELFHGPFFDWDNSYVAFPFRSARYANRTFVTEASLTKSISAIVDDVEFWYLSQMINTSTSIPDDIVSLSLKAATIFMMNDNYRYGVAFLCHAQRDFFVYPGQLEEVIYEGAWTPTRASELARWESAFQNSYKAIEAVVGDPGSDRKRFRSRLLAAGIDPDEEVGYKEKVPIFDVILQMNEIRDSKVAHGSTPSRGIKLDQMVEYQECARYVLGCTLENQYGDDLYERS